MSALMYVILFLLKKDFMVVLLDLDFFNISIAISVS